MRDRKARGDWEEYEVPPDAWRRADSGWDVKVMLDLLSSLAVGSRSDAMAPELVRRIVPPEALREVDLVLVDRLGAIRHPTASRMATDLLSWVVECVWGGASGLDQLRKGYTLARMRSEDPGVLVHLCIPLCPTCPDQELVACSFTGPSLEEALRLGDQLTVLTSIVSVAQTGQDTITWPGEPSGDGAGVLTARQLEILHGMAEGMTNRQIAARICFSESTVRLESMAIYRYFGVHSRTQAVAAARASGLLGEHPLSLGA